MAHADQRLQRKLFLGLQPQEARAMCPEQSLISILLLQMSLASRTPKDQGMCHVLEQVCSVLKQGS